MKWFNRKEFECKCGCGQDTIDYRLAEVLDDVREYFGVPVRVTSGNRCVKHNSSVGGAKTSQHLYGKAADIVVSITSPLEVYNYLTVKYPAKYGIGLYSGWVHVDVRPLLSRWNKS